MTGNIAKSDHADVTAAAVSNNSGRYSSTSRAIDVSAACTVTFIAAAVRPDRSRTGAAIERMPSESSSSDSAQPRSRISASDSSSSVRDSTTRGMTLDADGVASTSSSVAGSRSASNTSPIDVAVAGKRVPICTEMAMILGTGPGPCTRCRCHRAATSARLAGSARRGRRDAGGRCPTAPGRRRTRYPARASWSSTSTPRSTGACTRAARVSSAGAAPSAGPGRCGPLPR